mmetsp:Transcript_22256/g.44840  ORF Transcript_22256/g.44840 Transcript_22256/m.44840 type:complete len:223 (+) Transcript_22256:123-791(+)
MTNKVARPHTATRRPSHVSGGTLLRILSSLRSGSPPFTVCCTAVLSPTPGAESAPAAVTESAALPLSCPKFAAAADAVATPTGLRQLPADANVVSALIRAALEPRCFASRSCIAGPMRLCMLSGIESWNSSTNPSSDSGSILANSPRMMSASPGSASPPSSVGFSAHATPLAAPRPLATPTGAEPGTITAAPSRWRALGAMVCEGWGSDTRLACKEEAASRP